jgi:putative flippase GtrA
MGKTLSKLFVDNANSTLLQFFRNALVGSFAFVLELGLMYLLTECAHVYYLWSSLFSSLCAGGINYLLSTIWVFNQSKVKNKPLEFILFTAIGALGLLLNVFFLWLLTDCIGIYYMFSKVIAMILVFTLIFFIRKYVLFTTKKTSL